MICSRRVLLYINMFHMDGKFKWTEKEGLPFLQRINNSLLWIFSHQANKQNTVSDSQFLSKFQRSSVAVQLCREKIISKSKKIEEERKVHLKKGSGSNFGAIIDGSYFVIIVRTPVNGISCSTCSCLREI